MADALAIKPKFRATVAVRRASSDCCGAKLAVSTADEGTQSWECRGCGQPCDRVLSDAGEVTAGG
jgi:hypothetical protein